MPVLSALSGDQVTAVVLVAAGLILMIVGPVFARLRIWHVPRYSWQFDLGPSFRLNRLGRFIVIVESELVGGFFVLIGCASLFPGSWLSSIPVQVLIAVPLLAFLIFVVTYALHLSNALLDMNSR